ncbi:MAG: hypoxanthine phosphoribosyltransferase [Bacteroidales bacterium]|jgi:hypoxanthine phosphoribosyltransferase
MESIKIKDKEFSLSIPAEQINRAVCNIAEKINKEYNGKDPVFLVILNGAFMFAADLFKELTIQCEVSFVKLASYAGIKTTEVVKTIIGLNEDIRGKSIIIVEDIVDTGNTIEDITESLNKLGPDEVKICTMLFKPGAYRKNIKIDYIGVEIPNDFIVGHGLDYDGFGRNLTDIYKIVE